MQIKFNQFTSYNKHGHFREYSADQIITIREANEYAEGELMPYDAALLVRMKRASVVEA